MDQVADVRSKTDIVALLQQYLPLKKAGHNFKANCPFHNESSPSFVVSPERQIWHCFGCQLGGDVFSFLMQYEHIEFPEALRMLADKAGITLLNQHIDTATSSKKETFYKLNHIAAEFFYYLLTQHTLGKEALNYVLKKRQVKPQTLRTFQIGYSPRGNALTTYLTKKKGYKISDVLEAGLATKRASGAVMDFFQGRLMFALCDHRDNIVGFSGRVLESTEKTSKYINTKETLIYHKGMTFFGFNIAKESIKKENLAILMEGELDVISAFQEGITNTVAVKGTALTEDQVALLSRFCQRVSLCFDMDAAGQDAIKRSLAILERKGMTTSIILLSGGKDADEVIQKNPGIFMHAVKHPEHVYDYLLTQAVNKYNSKTVDGMEQISDELLPLIGNISNEIVKEHYIRQLAQAIDSSQEALEKELIKKTKETGMVKKVKALLKIPRSREDILEEYLLGLLVQSSHANSLLQDIQQILYTYEWKSPSFQKILVKLESTFPENESYDPKKFIHVLSPELLVAFDTCYLLQLPSFDDDAYKKEVIRVAVQLQQIFLKTKLKVVGNDMRLKEKEGKDKEVEDLQEELRKLLEQLHTKE